MELADRQLETEQVAAERVAAFRRGSKPGAQKGLPAQADLDDAAELLRRDLDASEE